jgi:hypothetical protein
MANRLTPSEVINKAVNPLTGSQYTNPNQYQNQQNTFVLGGNSGNRSAL